MLKHLTASSTGLISHPRYRDYKMTIEIKTFKETRKLIRDLLTFSSKTLATDMPAVPH